MTFRLNQEEFDLYKAVTAYINEFLPQASGRKKQSVALTRTVLQRRLASSTQAIAESIRRRFRSRKNCWRSWSLCHRHSGRNGSHRFKASSLTPSKMKTISMMPNATS